MDRVILINNIQKILDKYKELDAKFWEIGTDWYNSIHNLIDNIDKNKLDDCKYFDIKEVEINNKNKRYIFVINNINITPNSGKPRPVAWSTIRQYLQELDALTLVEYCQDLFKEKEKRVNFNWSRWKLIKNSYIDYIYQSMFKSMFSSRSSTINLWYSVFICLILKYDELIFYEIKNHLLEPVRYTNAYNYTPDNLSSKKVINHIKKVYGGSEYTEYLLSIGFKKDHIGKSTHVNAIKNLNNKFEFEKIVDTYIKVINNPTYMDNIFDNAIKHDIIYDGLIKKYTQKIDSARNIAINKILNDRNIIDNNYYSDLSNLEINYSKECLAKCHIYDIEWIKHDCIKDIMGNKDEHELEKYIQYASDPKNILLLDNNIHKIWDKHEYFDFCKDTGKLIIINKEKINDIINLFGKNYDNVRIKTPPFDDKMKFYFNKI